MSNYESIWQICMSCLCLSVPEVQKLRVHICTSDCNLRDKTFCPNACVCLPFSLWRTSVLIISMSCFVNKVVLDYLIPKFLNYKSIWLKCMCLFVYLSVKNISNFFSNLYNFCFVNKFVLEHLPKIPSFLISITSAASISSSSNSSCLMCRPILWVVCHK